MSVPVYKFPQNSPATQSDATCADCRFWDDVGDPDFEDFGLCRRYAPHPVTIPKGGEYEARWPSTHEEDCCGEHWSRAASTPAATPATAQRRSAGAA